MPDAVSTDTSSTTAKWLFKAGTASGDHGQINSVNVRKWATEMLIPNMLQNRVVVMDNAPYHSVQECSNKVLHQNRNVGMVNQK